MTTITADYIYIQLAQTIHEDQPRILTASGDINKTFYISDLTSQELLDLNNLINDINNRLNNQNL